MKRLVIEEVEDGLKMEAKGVTGNDMLTIISALVMKLSEDTDIPTEFIQRDITLFIANNKITDKEK